MCVVSLLLEEKCLATKMPFAAALSVTAPGRLCLRGKYEKRTAEITIVISTMYSVGARWYTEKQANRSGDARDTHGRKRGNHTLMRTVRLARWLFLLWLGLVYLWGMLSYFGAGEGNDCHLVGETRACYTAFFPALNASSFQFKVGPDFPALSIFTVCIALYGLLCWVVLSTKIERRLYWLACLLQGGLVLVAKLAIQGDVGAFGDGIALALYLALCVQALVVLKQLRPFLLAASGYLLL